MIGGRSGNRGECAQPCRLPYELIDDRGKTAAAGHLLSPADMGLLGSLAALTEAGVDSLKIEGRLKSPEYVAAVTAAYRRQLDRIAESGRQGSLAELADDTARMRQVFSRGPFTDAYLRGRSDGELMSVETAKHTGIPIGELIRYDRKRGHATVRLTGTLRNGDGVEIRDGEGACGNIITYIRSRSGKLLQEAEPGMTVEIGDLKRTTPGNPGVGAALFRISSAILMKELRSTYEKLPSRIPVDLQLTAVAGTPARLTAETRTQGVIIRASVTSEFPLEMAKGRPLDAERAEKNLRKTGGTPYVLRRLRTKILGDPYLSASELNTMRRSVLEQLTAERLEAARRKRLKDPGNVGEGTGACQSATPPSKKNGKVQNSVILIWYYRTPGVEERIREMASLVNDDPVIRAGEEMAIPFELLIGEGGHSKLMRDLNDAGIAVRAVLPAVTRKANGSAVRTAMPVLESMWRDKRIAGVYAGNISHLYLLGDGDMPFSADIPLNVLNTETLRTLLLCGADTVTLSVEPDALRSASAGAFGSRSEIIVYGRTPAMYLAHCPVGAVGASVSTSRPDCTNEKKRHYCRKGAWSLKDRKGAGFPVVADDSDCSSVIYSHTVTDRLSQMDEFLRVGVRRFRICVFDESAEKIFGIIKNL